MTPTELKAFLLYCLLFNYLVLFIWFGVFTFARPWLRRLHGKWFQLSDTTFDAIHYGGMSVYKIGVLLFNLAPLVALTLLSH